MGKRNLAQMVLVTWPIKPPCSYMLKTLNIFFSGTNRPMTYQVCSYDDPGLTLTYFTARSNLVPDAFVWEKVKQWIFQKLL